MNASELRIGNFVYWPTDEGGQECQVDGVKTHISETIFFKDRFIGAQADAVKPIPLTVDWLKRFGFDFVNNWGYSKMINEDGDMIGYYSNRYFLIPEDAPIIGYWVNVKIEYVHQLQNLYFALTGEELTPEHLSEDSPDDKGQNKG